MKKKFKNSLKVSGFLKEFRDFAVRGNVIDMAVGIIIGGAFTPIVNSLVSDIIMPPIGYILGEVDFTDLFFQLTQRETLYKSLAKAKKAGAVTINYGIFIDAFVSFLITAFAVFMLVKFINKLRNLEAFGKQEEAPATPTTKECPYCCSTINIKATKCPFCASEIADKK